MSALHCGNRAIVAAAVLSALAPAGRTIASQTPPDQNAKTLEAFKDRVHQYVTLHQKIESLAGKLPDSATPQQIDTVQRALGRDVMAARTTARHGLGHRHAAEGDATERFSAFFFFTSGSCTGLAASQSASKTDWRRLATLGSVTITQGSQTLTPNMFERVIGACDTVTMIHKLYSQDPTLPAGNVYERFTFDTFQVRNGKLTEHWDGTLLPTPAPAPAAARPN